MQATTAKYFNIESLQQISSPFISRDLNPYLKVGSKSVIKTQLDFSKVHHESSNSRNNSLVQEDPSLSSEPDNTMLHEFLDKNRALK